MITTLVQALKTRQVHPRKPPFVLNVVRFKGSLFSLNNRRLWCLKEYYEGLYDADCVPPSFVMVYVWPLASGVLFEGREIIPRFFDALTTSDDGRTVIVRG